MFRPMSTAPKDGSQILAKIKEDYYDVVIFSNGAWRETASMMRTRDEPLGWQPINDVDHSENLSTALEDLILSCLVFSSNTITVPNAQVCESAIAALNNYKEQTK